MSEGAGLSGPQLDFGQYDMPTAQIGLFLSEGPETTVEDAIASVLDSFQGWSRFKPGETAALTGAWSITAGTKAVTGLLGTLAKSELAVGALWTLNGELHRVAAITADDDVTLVDNHFAGAFSDVGVGLISQLEVDFVQDPTTQTPEATFGPTKGADATGNAVIARQDPEEAVPPFAFRLSYRLTHHPEPNVSPAVPAALKDLWAAGRKWVSQLFIRNQTLDPRTEELVIDARFRRSGGALNELTRQVSLHSRFRPLEKFTLRDPGRVLRPGRYIRMNHIELRGGTGKFLVQAQERQPGPGDLVQAELWGYIDEP